MNIAKANSEAFYRFHRFHEEFTRNMRVAFGAIEAQRELSRVDLEAVVKVVSLPTGGEPWGASTEWRDVSKALSDAARFLSQMGLVRVVSAFEDFLVGVEGEHERYLKLLNPEHQSPPQKEMSEGARLASVCERLGGNTEPLNWLLPLFDYFSIARNCVAHRSGRASEALVAKTEQADFQNCLVNWRTPRGEKLPALPILELHRDIKFLPRHSILASDVFYRAAQHVNARLVQNLGATGIVYMAAYHALLRDDRILSNAYKSPTQVINYALFNRYKITEASTDESTALLKEMNKWNACRKRFQKLYPGNAT